MKTQARIPAVAGRYYPASPDQLRQDLEELFSRAKSKNCNNVRAVISPHAGYVFSGKVAASAFNQIDSDKRYERIFIIGSSHQVALPGAAVYTRGNFLMPYGIVKTDIDFCKKLVLAHPGLFTEDSRAHRDEHSLEVQLPFLHHVLKYDYMIVPIIIGTSDPSVCQRIAKVLAPYFNQDNLFVISSDFSHYPGYEDARTIDAATKDAILQNDPDVLLQTLKKNSLLLVPGLATSLCAWTSVLTLLHITAGNSSFTYKAIDYQNSGDARLYADRSQVVGYWAIAVTAPNNDCGDRIQQEEQEMLLEIARQAIESVVVQGKHLSLKQAWEYPPVLQQQRGAFVTLYMGNKLRGCIGRMTADLPLFKLVRDMAEAAALYDNRFLPVQEEELGDLEIHISVLSPLEEIRDPGQIQLGKHGILIESGGRSGVFLPQVATETGWSLEEFLGHCSRDKAGLGWEGWKTARIFVFSTTDIPG
ncbi:MAG TPA: AmmeMemoRadiSam system protein B [Bacteroidales bacterium]|nr:AmmeMemoRadiSam system protein B [Bacteroidales bacterium]